MLDYNPNRHPSGPQGGQFAEKLQSEAANVHLGAPATSAETEERNRLRATLAGSSEKLTALEKAEWAETVWEDYPHAAFAEVHVASEGGGSLVTAGVDLYDAEGNRIDVDMNDEAIFEEEWEPTWHMGYHADDARVGAVMGPYSKAFSLDSVKERWDVVKTRATDTDPFAHLTGMEKARAQAQYALEINNEAAGAYVQDLSAKLLAVNPDFSRLYVNRNVDVETGLTFNLDRVEDKELNIGDIDLDEFGDNAFHDIHLDRHLEHDELTDELYINLDRGN